MRGNEEYSVCSFLGRGWGQRLLSKKPLAPVRAHGRQRLGKGWGGHCGTLAVMTGQHFRWGTGEPIRTDCLLELPARESWESSPRWVLEGILVPCLFKGTLCGLVFNVPISDFLKMWLTSLFFIPPVNIGAKQISMDEQPLMMNHPFPITSPYSSLPSQV